MADPFILSIEPLDGPAYQHGFHLGTDLRVARSVAEEVFTRKAARTVAIMDKPHGQLVDVFDGLRWTSDLHDAFWEGAA